MTLRYPPFVRPGVRPRDVPVHEGAVAPPANDDLPSIEQFIDELPSIVDLDYEPDGWAAGPWQSYDWSSVAGLGHSSGVDAEADASWESTEWSRERSGYPTTSELGAHEVAAAMDEIAERIRSGELSIDQFRGTPPEAAIAAALAAFLKLRG